MLTKVSNLDVKKYLERNDINPRYTYYQTVPERNANLSKIEFRTYNSNPDALLLSYAQVRYSLNITKRRSPGGAAQPFHLADSIRLKPFMPATNAMTRSEIRINGGKGYVLDQQRIYSDALGMMYGSPNLNKNLSSAGGKYNSLTSRYTLNTMLPDTGLPYDINLAHEEARFNDLLRRSPEAGYGSNTAVIRWNEPLFAGLFSPFLNKKHIPEFCPLRYTSTSIQGVKSLYVRLDFSKLEASSLLYMNGRHNDGAAAHNMELVSIATAAYPQLSANLTLFWIIPPKESIMPPLSDPEFQSFHIRTFTMSSPSGVVNNNVQTTYDSGRLVIDEIPELILIYMKVDQDASTYACISRHASQLGTGGGTPLDVDAQFSNSADTNSLETYMEIDDMTIRVNGKNTNIDRLNQEELYNLHLSNSDMENYPYDFARWRSLRSNTATGNMPSKCIVSLRPHQISEQFSSGTKKRLHFRVNGNCTARDGFGELIPGGNKNYKGYVVFLFGHKYENIRAGRVRSNF